MPSSNEGPITYSVGLVA